VKQSRFPGGWLIVGLALAPCLPGCAVTFPQSFAAKPMLYPAVPATVFVANGAGDFQMTSKALHDVLAKDGYPIEVITFNWSHGKRRVLADQTDYRHARCAGMQLAVAVKEYHEAHPDRPIYLVGHSAGAVIVLSALEHVPPDIVERGVLMAQSVSAHYDLRPALRSVKEGIHVFYSERDNFYLGFVMRFLWTSERLDTMAAGRVGFCPTVDPEDADQFKKLIQHPWQPSDRQLGNNGGHFGTYQPDFLRVSIFPLLNPNGCLEDEVRR
jgi:hypothetical protein